MNFLKSWGIDVELRKSTTKAIKKSEEFSLTAGLWEDYQIDSTDLRNQAWQRNK